MSDTKVRVLIVEARFYSDLADELLRGASQVLDAYGAEYEVVTVPGALEIPGAIALAEASAHRPTGGIHYDGYVALGTVIRGETYHFEIVAGESARGIMALTMDGVAIGNGILTVENEEQALVRADPAQKDKGGEAAKAALALLALKQRFDA
jgi:6,7-dimethyl-8-ribityllumazine synthase